MGSNLRLAISSINPEEVGHDHVRAPKLLCQQNYSHSVAIQNIKSV